MSLKLSTCNYVIILGVGPFRLLLTQSCLHPANRWCEMSFTKTLNQCTVNLKLSNYIGSIEPFWFPLTRHKS